ncbi:MAG: heat-inducible transcription repressor HrcA [Acidimicrobiales bacterium]|nr:heat-inducible transcription repressor HrcA [Acidimicrobiales bacterium]
MCSKIGPTVLDDRKAAILSAIVGEYIETAQPVGSGAVRKSAYVDVSAATIRNEMASLETDGYLWQPHTSAGRVPTEKGYRHFVDKLGEVTLDGSKSQAVAEFFHTMEGQIEGRLQQTAGLLSNLTKYTAVVVDLGASARQIKSVQLVRLAPATLLVVVVDSTGEVYRHSVESDTDLDDDGIESVQSVLRAALEDHRLDEKLAEPSSTGNPLHDRLIAAVFELIVGGHDDDRVYVNGTSNVAQSFEAVESVRQVLTILEQQLLVVKLISDVLDRGMRVAIGTETGVEPLEECSVVVSPYRVDGEVSGSIAVLGPTRMHYRESLAAVTMVSRQLEQRLNER